MGIYDAAKDALSIAQKADNIDLYQKILDIQALALDLQYDNLKLIEEIKKLKKDEEIDSKLIFKNNSYYMKDNEKEDGPFCSVCWDKDRKLVRMHKDSSYYMYRWICPIDNSVFNTREVVNGETSPNNSTTDVFMNW